MAIHRFGLRRGASRSRSRVPPSAVSMSRRRRSDASRRGTRSGAARARIEIVTGSCATAGTIALHHTMPSLPGARSTVAHGRTCGCSIGPISVRPSRSSASRIHSCVAVSHSGSVHFRSSPTSTRCSVTRVPEPALVTVARNGLVESTHLVHVAVTRADGTLVAGCGDVDRPTTMRSCAKPHQVEPLIASGGFDALDNCIGTPEEKLRHNCSGNHLGFLALSVHSGWDTAGYRHPGHPSQDAALAEVAARTGLAPESIPTCTDGCGVVAFELPLTTIATMYARLPEELPRQFAAMRAHPELVRGDGDLDTELMRALPGVVAKGGAEALASVGIAGEQLGVAVRVEDGGYRAIDPVLIETLRQVLGWESVPNDLQEFAEPVIPNFVGDRVVRLTARVELSTRAG